jgi:hypothetical protein
MLALPTLSTPVHDRRPDTTTILPLLAYDFIILCFSGGRDSLAATLSLLEAGVPPSRLQLWHQSVDGEPNAADFMDWPCTPGYCRAVAHALGLRILFQYRHGGFLREMLKANARTAPVTFDRQDGTQGTAGGVKGKLGTRRRFPQPTANLAVRWCSAVLKIDAAALAITNEPAFRGCRLLFVTGERRQESSNRSQYAQAEKHRCSTRSRRVDHWRNVLDWDEGQVWDIIRRWRMVPHPAYRLGFGRVSCMACIFGQADQWASVRLIAPEVFGRIAAYEREFGCTIKHGLTVEQLADRGTPYPNCSDPDLVKLAMGRDYPAELARLPEGTPWAVPAGAFCRCGGPS